MKRIELNTTLKTQEELDLLIARLQQLTIEEPQPTCIEELGMVEGIYIGEDSLLHQLEEKVWDKECKKVFKTTNQAISSLAKSQLSQLMYRVNGDWRPDWKRPNIKYCIVRREDVTIIKNYSGSYQFLTFESEVNRDEFFIQHRDLINQYFELH